MTSKAMRRAERSSRAVLHGAKILQLVCNPKNRERLVTAAKLGMPPVTAISSAVQKLVGENDAKLAPIKQFTGLCVRAVLEEEGFELLETGVRISNDPIFRTGSVYQRSDKKEVPPAYAILARFIRVLTDEVADYVIKLRQRRR